MECSSRVPTSPWKPKNVIFFFKKLEIDEIEFCPYPEFSYAEKRNRPGFVNISPTLVIDTSTERSFEIEIDLCWRAEINIQVGLNMHLYVDIGDASSSLWGSTSSSSYFFFNEPNEKYHKKHQK